MKKTNYTNIIVKYRQNGHYYGMQKSEDSGCDGCVFSVKCAENPASKEEYQRLFRCGDGKIWTDFGDTFPSHAVSDFCTFFEI